MSESNKFPSSVIVRVGQPIKEGLAIALRFGMRAKNPFTYIVFLDGKGQAEVPGEGLLRAFDEERNAFIMDYGDPRTAFTGEITAKVLRTAGIGVRCGDRHAGIGACGDRGQISGFWI